MDLIRRRELGIVYGARAGEAANGGSWGRAWARAGEEEGVFALGAEAAAGGREWGQLKLTEVFLMLLLGSIGGSFWLILIRLESLDRGRSHGLRCAAVVQPEARNRVYVRVRVDRRVEMGALCSIVVLDS